MRYKQFICIAMAAVFLTGCGSVIEHKRNQKEKAEKEAQQIEENFVSDIRNKLLIKEMERLCKIPLLDKYEVWSVNNPTNFTVIGYETSPTLLRGYIYNDLEEGYEVRQYDEWNTDEGYKWKNGDDFPPIPDFTTGRLKKYKTYEEEVRGISYEEQKAY